MEGIVRMERANFEFPLDRYVSARSKGRDKLLIELATNNGKTTTWEITGPAATLDELDRAIAEAKGLAAEEVLVLRKRNESLALDNERLTKENGRLKINREHLITARDQLYALRESAFWENLHLAVKQRLSRARNELYKALLRG